MLKAINDGAHNCTWPATSSIFSWYASYHDNGAVWITVPHGFVFLFTIVLCHLLYGREWGSPVYKGLQYRRRGRVNGVFINLLLNHGVRGLQGIYFFDSAQVASAGCMCSVIVYFLHCICVCDCDSRHESLIMLSHSVMVRHSHLLARCYLGTMCMCTTIAI
jgi:hypothetical protein